MKPPALIYTLVLVPGLLFTLSQPLLASGAAAALPADRATAPAHGAETMLEQFFHDYLEAAFRLSPTWATRLGDHRFDRFLDDVSADARARRTALSRETLQRLAQHPDFSNLPAATRVDFEMFRDNLQLELWREEIEKPFERDPRIYTALASEAVYTLFAQSTQPKEASIDSALARMALIPQMLATGRSNLRNPPRVVTETAIKQNRGAIGFYTGELFELIGETPRRDELKTAAATVAAALRVHQRFLEDELLPRSNGEWRLGKERFAHKLELVLNTGVTADETLADAEAQFAQTRRDLLLVARQLWSRFFPREPLPPDDEEGHRATIERACAEVGRDHATPETLVAEARATVAKLKGFIADRDLLRLPDPDRCDIIEMPEFQRGNATAFLEPAPTLDAQARSIYAISPPPGDWDAERVAGLLRDMNRRMLQVLTIHEAYPGHYVQLAYASRHASLIRRVFGSGVLEEGWAVYGEQMMLDQGYGDGDLALRLMQLKFLLLATGNAILDYKMHCTPMSDDEALHFLTEEVLQSEGAARMKIIRAKQSSVQLSTYFAGRSAIMRVRQQLQRELGDTFQLGRFHEALLEQGSVPVKNLTELVRARLREPR